MLVTTPAMADFTNPLFLAILIGWILTVVLHEFAHGIVAHWGGDYTIAERGGLSLNPIQYIDPVMSLLLPAIFLLMGGVPLPGGVTYVRMDLLRSRVWQSAVSAAGPTMNLLLFLIGAIALHPKVGWVPYDTPVIQWSNAHLLVATLTSLQLFATLLSLIPCPPLDGFGMISPYIKAETREKLMTPPLSIGLMVLVFFLIMRAGGPMLEAVARGYSILGFSDGQISSLRVAFSSALSGK